MSTENTPAKPPAADASLSNALLWVRCQPRALVRANTRNTQLQHAKPTQKLQTELTRERDLIKKKAEMHSVNLICAKKKKKVHLLN